MLLFVFFKSIYEIYTFFKFFVIAGIIEVVLELLLKFREEWLFEVVFDETTCFQISFSAEYELHLDIKI